MTPDERAAALGRALAVALTDLYQGRLRQREYLAKIDRLWSEHEDMLTNVSPT